MPTVGSFAPSFSLFDQEGQNHDLNTYKGKWVVLYFYPKDDTPGCTKEACAIRDVWQELNKRAVVLGVSTDSVGSHKKFSEKYKLPFPLLADIHKEVVTRYQVAGRLGTKRTTFIINPEGTVMKMYEKVKPENHALEILDDLSKLQQ